MNNKNNLPIVSLLCAVGLVVIAAVVIIIAPERSQDAEKTVLSLIITLVPSLVAAAFAERASRDIRNGVVVQKAKEGATKALVETGVVTETPATTVPTTSLPVEAAPVAPVDNGTP